MHAEIPVMDIHAIELQHAMHVANGMALIQTRSDLGPEQSIDSPLAMQMLCGKRFEVRSIRTVRFLHVYGSCTRDCWNFQARECTM
jgi:hypothetical protein